MKKIRTLKMLEKIMDYDPENLEVKTEVYEDNNITHYTYYNGNLYFRIEQWESLDSDYESLHVCIDVDSIYKSSLYYIKNDDTDKWELDGRPKFYKDIAKVNKELKGIIKEFEAVEKTASNEVVTVENTDSNNNTSDTSKELASSNNSDLTASNDTVDTENKEPDITTMLEFLNYFNNSYHDISKDTEYFKEEYAKLIDVGIEELIINGSHCFQCDGIDDFCDVTTTFDFFYNISKEAAKYLIKHTDEVVLLIEDYDNNKNDLYFWRPELDGIFYDWNTPKNYKLIPKNSNYNTYYFWDVYHVQTTTELEEALSDNNIDYDILEDDGEKLYIEVDSEFNTYTVKTIQNGIGDILNIEVVYPFECSDKPYNEVKYI